MGVGSGFWMGFEIGIERCVAAIEMFKMLSQRIIDRLQQMRQGCKESRFGGVVEREDPLLRCRIQGAVFTATKEIVECISTCQQFSCSLEFNAEGVGSDNFHKCPKKGWTRQGNSKV